MAPFGDSSGETVIPVGLVPTWNLARKVLIELADPRTSPPQRDVEFTR